MNLSFLKTAALAAACFLFNSTQAQCLNSSLVLDSARFTGTEWEVYATACIGAGTDGVVKGGLADTKNFFFGFYSGSGSLTLNNFFPPFIFGDTTLYYNNGVQFGPVPSAPFNGTAETLGFTGGAGTFTCVSNQTTCGMPHTDCTQYIFYLNELPDSIRLFGAEANNVYGGNCYPETQMRIAFGLLPVVWGIFDATPVGNSVNLTWATHNEQFNHHFEVMRSLDGENFYKIAETPASGTSRTLKNYHAEDLAPHSGLNYYRIDQVDMNGSRSSTDIRTVKMYNLGQLAWVGAYPNPARQTITLQFESDGTQSLNVEILDGSLRSLKNIEVAGNPGLMEVPVSLENFPAGLYHVRAHSGSSQIMGRFVKN